MKPISILLCCLGLSLWSYGQFEHLDFLGAGHDNSVMVTTSSNSNNTTGQKTVDGFPIQNTDQLKNASRFLAQCTFGADMSVIRMTAATGFDAWLDEQFALPKTSIVAEAQLLSSVYDEEANDSDGIYGRGFTEAANHNIILSNPDVLRHRMSFILSQIMVINNISDLFEDFGSISSNYYDLLATDCFENYRTLLEDVTLSPAMGLFLSHYGNPKANPDLNIHPDENYAREIMQLFSIGLWELNPNGTYKYDTDGNFIPTYTNADIKEFAQVFTGLASGVPGDVFGQTGEDGNNFPTSVEAQMAMYEDYHDTSEKHLLNGVVLPAGQAGMVDIAQTLDHLSTHPNTAPFIATALIKFMTTSNPSPTYVGDVAAVFNPSAANNFQDVIRAILLHPEARTCTPTATYTFGKLREPFVRRMNYIKAWEVAPNQFGDFELYGNCYNMATGQAPLWAPSVFNFFLPTYQPQGVIGQNYLYGPEFQILNSTNSIGLVNEMNTLAVNRVIQTFECEDMDPFPSSEDLSAESDYPVNLEEVLPLAANATDLIDYLDILLANGLLEEDTKTIIANAVSQLSDPIERIRLGNYLILISPDYAILK